MGSGGKGGARRHRASVGREEQLSSCVPLKRKNKEGGRVWKENYLSARGKMKSKGGKSKGVIGRERGGKEEQGGTDCCDVGRRGSC